MSEEKSLKSVIDNANWRFFVSFYRTIGLWPPVANPEKPLPRRLYFLWTFVLHSTCTFLYISTMIINIFLTRRIADMYIILTFVGTVGKTSIFLYRQTHFRAFVKDLFNNPIYALKDDDTEREIYRRNLRHYRIIVNFYIWSCLSVIFIAGVSSIFSDPIRLSWPAWFPFDYKSSRNLAYYCIFIYQNCGITMHCLMNGTWDCLMPFLMFNLHSQFQVLRHRFEVGFTEPKNGERTRQELVDNIEHYSALVRFNKELQEMMALPFALQIIITGVVLCLTLVQMISMSPMKNLAEFMLYIIYMACMLTQVYMQCYFGSLAAHESTTILHASFSGNWLEIDLKNRKLLMMFMIRLRAECKMKTMKVLSIDRTTFMTILNLSYSMFAVMSKTKTLRGGSI